jgi:hypothetical protein
MDSSRPWASAVAVLDNHITYVGDEDGAEDFVGAGTEEIDLGGAMLLPGFIDAHNHLVSGMSAKQGVDVAKAAGLAEVLRIVGQHAATQPAADLVTGFGWSFGQVGGHPTAADLDSVVPDRPVVLTNADNHGAWFNSAAMRRAGITADTPDPVPGLYYWLRDEAGAPDGVGCEGAWMRPVIELGYWQGERSLRDWCTVTGLALAPPVGLTAYVDAGVISPNLIDGVFEDFETAYRVAVDLDNAGRLPVRIQGSFSLHQPTVEPKEAIALLAEAQRTIRSAHVTMNWLKIWADGATVTHSGCLIDPYTDRPDRPACDSAWTTDVLAAYLSQARSAGFAVQAHCDGDGAARRFLDAIERVNAEGARTDWRDALEHSSLVHPEDVARIGRLRLPCTGVPVWFTADWVGYGKTLRELLGDSRVIERVAPYKQIFDAGGRICFAADLPRVQPDEVSPLYHIQAAMTQRWPGGPPAELWPGAESRMWRLADALHAYTTHPAYKMGLEDQIGSIETGKLADLVVVGANLFEVDPTGLHQVPVLATMMDGQFTHRTF